MLEEVVSMALIGTQRQKAEISATSPSDSLNKMLSQLNTSDIEHNLLNAAAMLALYQRAGKVPSKLDSPLIEPCDLDDLPTCSPKINKLLVSLFKGKYAKVLPEFLSLLSKSGCRVQNETLCELLNYGHAYLDAREGISKVIGKRGQWLAEQNPSWSYAKGVNLTSHVPEELWQTGNKLTRINLLKKLRKENRAKAHELVLSTWKEEPADYRFASISTFKETLAIDDEPFLETALDDRAKDIKLEAQKLLLCLSDSRFHSRMLERLRLIVKLKTEKKKTFLEIIPPENLDEMAIRDIVEQDSPNKDIGQKAWWLRKIVMAVKPSFWANEFKLSPKEIFSLIAKTDWAKDVFWGLSISISNHLDLEWIKPLLEELVEKKTSIDSKVVQEVFSKLSVAEKEEMLILFLSKEEIFHPSSLIGSLLCLYKDTWSKRLTEQVLNKTLEFISKNKKADWGFSNFLEQVAIHTPEIMFQQILLIFDEDNFDYNQWKAWEKIVAPFISLLKFRQKMLREFN